METVVLLEFQVRELAWFRNDLIDFLALVCIFEANNVDFVIICKKQVLLGETNVADYNNFK